MKKAMGGENVLGQRRVVLNLAVSLDGFLADEKGGVSWLGGETADYEGDLGFSDFLRQVDTVVMGMTTYRQIITELSPDRWPYEGKQCCVFTHRPPEKRNKMDENVTFLSGSMGERIRELKAGPGKWIWICGGAGTANQVIKADLIDEYRLTIMPILLGKGIPLFAGDNLRLPLQLERINRENGMAELVYTRR